MSSPSKLKQSFTADDGDEYEELDLQPRPLKAQSQTESSGPTTRSLPPTFATNNTGSTTSAAARNLQSISPSPPSSQTDNLSKLPPQLLHSMREAFSVLDSNSTGFITPASVVETISSLGLDKTINPTSLFPPNAPQQLSLPQFLGQLANILVALSSQQELLNAFSAFDDDDSGQADVAELKDALLNTAPEVGERAMIERDVDRALDGFTGRRVFTRSTAGIAGVKSIGGPSSGGGARKNGDVFRYQEFVGNLMGGPAMGESGQLQGQSQAIPTR